MTTLAALAALALSTAPFCLVLRALGPEAVTPDPPAPRYVYRPERYAIGAVLPERPDGLAALKAEIRASAEPINVYDLGLPALVPQRRILTGATA